MNIFNQPFDGYFGNLLSNKMQGNYNELILMAAFAKNSGVLRLRSNILDFHKKGGKIKAFIGLDADGTSYEAIQNLFYICDEVYVIHSENNSSTFHSKIYTLFNNKSAFVAIGSSNLTAGGMRTNFESNSIYEYQLDNSNHANQFSKLLSLISKYTDPNYACSKKINHIDDIDLLLENNYLSKEISQKMNHSFERSNSSHSSNKQLKLFGSEKVSLPKLIDIEQSHTSKKNIVKKNKTTKNPNDILISDFAHEYFWFEMRESTGGSRNILDLSMTGKIIEGTATNTKYAMNDPNFMYGGVTFFDINPSTQTSSKEITINYNGKDYFPSVIKLPSGSVKDNGTWRLQLRGKPSPNGPALSTFGKSHFVHNILVFEKIKTDYYVLSVLPQNKLDELKAKSKVYASNSKNPTPKSRTFGMLL